MSYIRREITDDLGYHWVWTTAKMKVYCVEAEEELKEKFQDNPTDDNLFELQQNGYFADSWREAVECLIDGGYIA